MFKEQVNTILNKQKNSIELLTKLHEVYNDYDLGGTKRDDIFYLDIRIERLCNIESRTRQELQNILTHNDINLINYIDAQKAPIEEITNTIKNITIKDFYFSVVKYFPYNSNKDYTLGNMTYTENRTSWQKLCLILNCIWLLSHDDIISDDVRRAIYKMSNKGETFIFNGCKVTHFKNNNLKIQFSDKELFRNFEKHFREALELAEIRHSERNNL